MNHAYARQDDFLQSQSEIPASDADRQTRLSKRVQELKRVSRAVVLAHNYQLPEIQGIADYVGDSLGLARQAAGTDAEVIVFCGVHFMAETASVLNPDKTVLLPEVKAGCSLADMVNADDIRRWKGNNPDGLVVSYVNTTAEVKAESDICCTSSNAVAVVESLPPNRRILFVPDLFLGAYVREKTGRDMQLWLGECHVHAGIRSEDLDQACRDHPGAELMIHPECGCTTGSMMLRPDVPMLSTSQMIGYAQKQPAREFLVATEVGILHQLSQQVPDKSFVPIRRDAVCPYMKMTRLESVVDALEHRQHVVKVPDAVAGRAKKAVERMLAV